MNLYCDIATFTTFYDARQMGMLSRDDNGRSIDSTKAQLILDAAASRLDSYLGGRYSLPLPWNIEAQTMPLSLTLWVAAHAAERSYLRRSDIPKQVKDDVEESDDWLKDVLTGTASLVDTTGIVLERAITATLDSSDSKSGRSRFDGLPGMFPPATPTSPSRGR